MAASVYVVGGAAMALAYGRDGVTPDIDAVASHQAVMDEALAMAARHGLTEHWLNDRAGPWVPPRPASTLDCAVQARADGPRRTAERVLAMELVALRRKDRPDIRLLIDHLDMAHASPEDYADLLERVYAGEGRLATALNVAGDSERATRLEGLAIGRWAHDFAARLRAD